MSPWNLVETGFFVSKHSQNVNLSGIANGLGITHLIHSEAPRSPVEAFLPLNLGPSMPPGNKSILEALRRSCRIGLEVVYVTTQCCVVPTRPQGSRFVYTGDPSDLGTGPNRPTGKIKNFLVEGLKECEGWVVDLIEPDGPARK